MDIYQAVVLFTLTASLFALLLWDKAIEPERAFFLLIFTNGFFEVVAMVSAKIGELNNLPGLHLYTVAQFVATTFFFKSCFKRLLININFNTILIIGTSLIILNSAFVQSIYSYNSYSKSAVELYIIAMSMVLFISFIRDRKHDQKAMQASVSFLSAIFLQSSVGLIMYMYSNAILAMELKLGDKIWSLVPAVNLLTQIIIILGIWQIYIKKRVKIKTRYPIKIVRT